jgi:hypothetical protein
LRPLIIANFERVEATKFIVAMLYDSDGQLRDGITLPCETSSTAFLFVRLLAETNGILDAVELWTSDTEIYAETLSRPGVFGFIKHTSDTIATRRMIEQDADILREVHEITPLKPKPKPAKWRAFLILRIRKLLKQLEGNGQFEI